MKPAHVLFTLFIVAVFFAVFILKRWKEPQQKEIFNRHAAHIYYTHHALCRMDCRHISKQDIDEIMQRGIVNLNKTNTTATPCPTYALQGVTDEGESIRVIVAQCSDETKVVTCYNLKDDPECHCPGDENKHL